MISSLTGILTMGCDVPLSLACFRAHFYLGENSKFTQRYYYFVHFFFHQHLTERVSGYVHAYTLYSSVRPFGVSMILGSIEEDGPQMYLIEPSGVSWVTSFISHFYFWHGYI